MLEDRVRDVTTTTGAGTTLSLAGSPPTGFSGFDIFANGSTVRYVDTDGTDYETWTGVYDSLTLTKVVLEESSQSNNPVNWTGGTQRVVFVAPTARDIVYQLPTFLGTTGGSANAQTLSPATVLRAYRGGRFMRVVWGFTNTAALTLQVSGLATPRAVKKHGPGGLQDCEGGEAIVGCEGDIFDTGTVFILLNPTRVAHATGAGILTRTGSTALSFAPKNGFLIPVNGIMRHIPHAGIAGGTTGVFVDGVGSSNLAINTDYLVTLFENSGAPTYDYISTLTHSPSGTQGNVGTEIPGTDDTRSVIGMVHIDASGHFNDSPALRNVASWFNRQNKQILGSVINSSTTSGSLTELNSAARVEAVIWLDDLIKIGCAGGIDINTGPVTGQFNIARDGSVNVIMANGGIVSQTAGAPAPMNALVVDGSATEGHHFWTFLASTNAGTIQTFNGTVTGEVRS